MKDLEFKIGDRNITINEKCELYDLIKKLNTKEEIPITLAKVNGKYYELSEKNCEGGTLEFVNITNSLAMRTYIRTLQFVFIKAAIDIFPNAKIILQHTFSKSLFGEIHKDTELTCGDVENIKKRMKEIIEEDIKINKIEVKREEAIKIFEDYKMEDKVKLLRSLDKEKVKLYELDGRYDYFYGSMAYSTGVIKKFDLVYYKPGFLLRYPTKENPLEIKIFKDQPQLTSIFYETEKWGQILEVGDVGSLNEKVNKGEIVDIIRVSEALHEKKIAYIADSIAEKKNVKMVLIAGPSSSGKTTFARRLGIQLKVNGLSPIPISLDDYFVNRENTPKDENGDYDFESIEAIDLKLFNEHLQQLIDGEEVEIPSFNFKLGAREWHGHKVKLPKNGVLVIEGIHGLNPMLTELIPNENKFKIYISALTQLNLDNHNRISTTDVRMIRRIVRDSLTRGYSAEDTIKMFPSIKRGEEKNIFVFQENADAMFNSTIVYELCVLRKYALKELLKVGEDSPVYYEALRLKSFLNFLYDVDKDKVPDNSILREFIGGSCFYKY